MRKWLEAVTNEDTLHPSTHDYWTLTPLGNFDDESSANSESVTEEKTNIKANLSEETDTDDEKPSGGNDGMVVEDREAISHIKAHVISEVDDVVGSKTKSNEVRSADGIDGKEGIAKKKRKEKRTGLKRFSTKS